MKLKKKNEVKCNVDTNKFFLYFNANTRIFSVDVDPKEYNLHCHFLFELTKFGSDKEKKPIKFKNIIANIAIKYKT